METQMSDRNQLTNPQTAHRFALGGNSTFTVVSKATGVRFTYRVTESKEGRNLFFVSLMNGQDNESSYQYLGTLRHGYAPDTAWHYAHGKKSRISAEAPSNKAFAWLWANLNRATLPDSVEFWSEGRCCVCNRKLTVPFSVANGIGPECAKRYRCD